MSVDTPVRRLTLVLLLAILVTWKLPQTAYADAAPRWTDEQLVGFSDVIVRGQVARVAVGRDERVGSLYTYVTLDVADVLKGSVPGRQIILKQLGGRLGATALEIAGQPTFAVGENVLVFLEVRPRDRTLAVTALWQGKFTIVSGGADGEVAVRQDPGGRARGVFGDQARSLATWSGTLRSRVASAATTSASAGAIDFAPSEAARATPDGGSSGAATASWRDATLARQAVRVDTVAPGQAQLAGGGEQEVRHATDFWTATGITTLATGGLQPSGCFTTREPDGRISVGVDACEELNPRGGTLAVSGGWVEYYTDASGAAAGAVGRNIVGDGNTVPRFRGAGVITNRGETATRLLARSACFEQLVKHEIGHTLGLLDGPDGGGVMAPSLNCDSGPAENGSRPTFVPLDPGVSRSDRADARDVLYDSIACVVGCRITASAAVTTTSSGPTNLTYTLVGSTLTLTWTAPASEGPFEYEIQAGSAPDGVDVADIFTGSAATSFSAAVGGNAVFYVRVLAVTILGRSAPSNEVVIVIGSPSLAPGPPSGLTASVAGTSVALVWSPPTTGGSVTSYVIQAGSSPGLSDLANFSTGSTAPFFSAAGVSQGTYYVRVLGLNSGGVGAPSNEVTVVVVTNCVAPGAPSNLAASVAGSNVVLSWTAGVGASSYQLQVGSAQGRVDLVDRDLFSTATTLLAPNVSAGTYFVRLRSINACGQSAPSNEAVIIIR
jgi:hypothetical protein